MTHNPTDDSGGNRHGERYIPLLGWMIAVLAGVLIPLRILSMGYVPADDAMRHVAKAISGRPWADILVLNPAMIGDEHPGWHAILGALHRWLGWDGDALITFSVAAPFVLLWLTLLLFGRRPEAMLLALFLGSLTAPATFERLLLGRPFLVILAAYVVLLRLWLAERLKPGWRVMWSVALISFCVWVHGSWYLFGIPAAGFALAGQWRKARWLTGSWLAGTLLGATFTGDPAGYLRQTTLHLVHTFGGETLERMLVRELQPDAGDLAFVAVIILVLLWRKARGEWNTRVLADPLFALAVLGWFLGLKMSRFWVDWGFPAALLWLAKEFQDVLEARLSRGRAQVFALACVSAFGVFVVTTRDTGARWTGNLTVEYLATSDPNLTGWLPEKGGIIYNADMRVFFRGFFENPHAEWRYILGFEPGIMPAEDFAILRKIQWNSQTSEAFEPWVRKMRPEDRLIIMQSSMVTPGVRGLEWRCGATDTWIGRLPRAAGGGDASR